MAAPPPRRGLWQLLERDQIIVYGLAALLLAAAVARYTGGLWASPTPLRSVEGAPPIDYQIDLNRAGVAELDLLPGIGPATAKHIVQYREQHGPFRQLDDLRNVAGMSRDRVAKLRGLATVGPSTPAGEPPR